MSKNNSLKTFFKYFLFGALILILVFMSYFFIGEKRPAQKISWGVNFSQKHTQNLGLDWKETYSALLDDLNVKHLKIAVHWDMIEPQKDRFYFEDLDWQIRRAEDKGAELLLVIGMKTPRWPECHIPEWAINLTKQQQQEEILQMLKKIVLRYRGRVVVSMWQVENESFFPFGNCPWVDKKFLKKEIDLVKSLDFQNRPIIISDSGEGSLWFQAAKLGDIVGTTMYRKVWFRQLGVYLTYPFPPIFFQRRARLIQKLFNKKVICVELQAEPWGPKLLYDSSIEEQQKSMNLEQFQKNIEFAKKTGLNKFYLWGAEWWFWLKQTQNDFQIWNFAKKLFNQ